jgi:hypothetical protein
MIMIFLCKSQNNGFTALSFYTRLPILLKRRTARGKWWCGRVLKVRIQAYQEVSRIK